MNLCIICMNKSKLTKLNECNHSFCEACIQQWFYVHKHNTCPMCRCVVPEPNYTQFGGKQCAHKHRHTFFSDDVHLSYLAKLVGAL